MPSENVQYAALSDAARRLVDIAGVALQRTSYPFASPASLRRRARNAAVSALEQAFAPQRRPQRTILGAFGISSGAAENDEVSSSVGQLWRDGWRCERDAAQHCLNFVRDAGHGLSGEITGLRSYADFAHVLMEWHEAQAAPALPVHHTVRAELEDKVLPIVEEQAPEKPPLAVDSQAGEASSLTDTIPARPLKRSRFFGSFKGSASLCGMGHDGLGVTADAGG